MNLKQLNNELSQGKLPDILNFSIRKDDVIDLEKLKYNVFHRDYSYYERRFPKGYESIPGFDKVIQSFADKNAEKDPEVELKKLQSIKESDEDTE